MLRESQRQRFSNVELKSRYVRELINIDVQKDTTIIDGRRNPRRNPFLRSLTEVEFKLPTLVQRTGSYDKGVDRAEQSPTVQASISSAIHNLLGDFVSDNDVDKQRDEDQKKKEAEPERRAEDFLYEFYAKGQKRSTSAKRLAPRAGDKKITSSTLAASMTVQQHYGISPGSSTSISFETFEVTATSHEASTATGLLQCAVVFVGEY